MTTALEGVEWSASRRGHSLPPGKTLYPLYRRLCEPQGRFREVQKISPSPGFDLRTVLLVASRYTDWATRPTLWTLVSNKTLLHSIQSLVIPCQFLISIIMSSSNSTVYICMAFFLLFLPFWPSLFVLAFLSLFILAVCSYNLNP